MPASKPSLLKKAQKVRLLAMDVDGVLTGGEIIVLESGEEVKIWNAQDRLILALLREPSSPLKVAWITGRTSKNVSWSAKDLGISFVVQGCKNKKAALEEILRESHMAFEQAAFIGDDLIDLPVLNAVGFSACPSNATNDVKKNIDYLSRVAGGQGAVRDVTEFILKAQNKWNALVSPYLR